MALGVVSNLHALCECKGNSKGQWSKAGAECQWHRHREYHALQKSRLHDV